MEAAQQGNTQGASAVHARPVILQSELKFMGKSLPVIHLNLLNSERP